LEEYLLCTMFGVPVFTACLLSLKKEFIPRLPAITAQSVLLVPGRQTALLGGFPLSLVLPLAAPFLAASAGLTFILSFTAYDVPSLFAVTTYPLEIFAEFSAGHDVARTTILATPALVVAALVLALVVPALRQATVRESDGLEGISWAWSAWLVAVQGMVFAVVAAQLLVPLVVLAARTEAWRAVVAEPERDHQVKVAEPEREQVPDRRARGPAVIVNRLPSWMSATASGLTVPDLPPPESFISLRDWTVLSKFG